MHSDTEIHRTRRRVLDDAPASNGWAPLFPIDLMAKDVGLAVATAAEHGLEMPVADVALATYREAQAAGLGELDYSAVARLQPYSE